MPVEVAQVFVSSTWLDLQPERQAVEAALHRLHETKFVGMEYFGSRDETTRRTSLDEVDRSRVYVGIIAGRYGSGITEDEYRRARELNLPCFVYFKHDSDIHSDSGPEWRDSDLEKAAKLLAFRQELQRNHIVSEFTSPGDLATRVTTDLHNWLVKEYLTPRLADAAQGRMARGQARELLTAIKDKSGLDEGLLAAARKVVILPLLLSLAVAAVALISATALGAYVYFNRNDAVYRVRATVDNERGVPVDNERDAPSELADKEKELGPENAALEPSVRKLAFAHFYLNQFVEAEPLFLRALALQEKANGGEHPAIALPVMDVARVYHSLKKYPEAEAAWKRALTILEKVVEPDHYRLIKPLRGYWLTLLEMGREAEAKVVQERIQAIEKKYPGYGDPRKQAS
jgi:Domain of unknown function (DUF4062)/Tetratricopeptide repeat